MNSDPHRARQAILGALDEQLASPEAPEVRFHFDRLLAQGIEEQEVRLMMAGELMVYISKVMRNEEYSYAEYVDRLARLPVSLDLEAGDEDEEAEDDASMEDQYFALIIFEIESHINAREREARARNILFTDSQVRSILNKVRKQAGGSAPKLARDSERDQILAAIYDDLLEARSLLEVEDEDSGGGPSELPTADWVAALRAVEDAIRSQSTGSGSRAYLDSLEDLIAEAEKQMESEE